MSSNILDPLSFGQKLYNTLPPSYRLDDELVNLALKRFLSSLSDGGFNYVIEEINGILNLLDPDKIDAENLPILFKHYGLEVFNGIPEEYLRKLLPLVSELFNKKGTVTAVEYLTSIVSGVKSTVEFVEDDDLSSMQIRLEMDYDTESNKKVPDREQLMRIIQEFVPFFCDVVLVYMYMFMDEGYVSASDSYTNNQVKHNTDDSGAFFSISQGFTGMLNVMDKKLNSTFIISNAYELNFEPDVLLPDKYIMIVEDTTGLAKDAESLIYSAKQSVNESSNVTSSDTDTYFMTKSDEDGGTLNVTELDNFFYSDIKLEALSDTTTLTMDAELLYDSHKVQEEDLGSFNTSIDEVIRETLTLSLEGEQTALSGSEECENKLLESMHLEDTIINQIGSTGIAFILNGTTSKLNSTQYLITASFDYDLITRNGVTQTIFS